MSVDNSNLKFPIPSLQNRYVEPVLIGEGAYGSVYKVFDKTMNIYVAAKIYKKLKTDIIRCKRAMREVELLFTLKHPYIVYPFDLYWDRDSELLVVIMEYAPYDLRTIFKNNVYLESIQIKKYMFYLVQVIDFIHSKRIVHRDIKSNNILLCTDQTLRLCDFGLSRSTKGLISENIDFDKFIRTHKEIDVSSESSHSGPQKSINPIGLNMPSSSFCMNAQNMQEMVFQEVYAPNLM